MPKQKIEVNENLNVSIGDLLKPKASENDNPLKINQEMAHTECSGEISDAKISKANTPNNSGTKKVMPRFGKVSIQHQRAGRGGKTVTLISISGETEYRLKHNLENLLSELKKSLGCGGRIEEGKIVLQGEIADRASEWFDKMRAKQ